MKKIIGKISRACKKYSLIEDGDKMEKIKQKEIYFRG